MSDIEVWSAYFAIPGILAFFVMQRRDLPFRRIFVLFVAFILFFGMTHLTEAAIFWWPAYRLAGVINWVFGLRIERMADQLAAIVSSASASSVPLRS